MKSEECKGEAIYVLRLEIFQLRQRDFSLFTLHFSLKKKRYLASPLQGEERGSSFLWLWRHLTLPRLLHLHLGRVVLHQGSSLEEGALYLIGCLTLLALTHEVYSQTGDIS